MKTKGDFKMLVFMYPESELNPNKVDEFYQEEANQIKNKGFKVSLMNDETFLSDDYSHLSGMKVIYRGWMKTITEYENIEKHLLTFNVTMITTTENYKSAHHLPSWIEKIKDFTPETNCFTSHEEAKAFLEERNENFLVKDFVKSLKLDNRLFIKTSKELEDWIKDVNYFKGHVEGGICLRKVESFIEESEKRIFVYNNVPYGDKIEIPDIIYQVISVIDLPFYTIDIIKNSKEEWRVVEIGDGQVSSAESWDSAVFSEIFGDL